MPFCSNCGTEIFSGIKFCPNCGAPQAPGVGSRQVPGASPAISVKRPGVAAILTVSHFSLGLVFVILGTLTISLGLSLPLGGSAFYISFGGLVLVVGVASLTVGYGFLRYRPWLVTLGTFTSVGYLIGGVLLLLSAGLLFLLGLLVLVQAAGTIVYLRRTSFKTLIGC